RQILKKGRGKSSRTKDSGAQHEWQSATDSPAEVKVTVHGEATLEPKAADVQP
ncbi:MAG TPA: RNA polymerase subunit sigma, partial [Verrucomicrobiales bacterium]|nr:RNA polymerase subunit sigma [Verrucomicrobiales bacterium]